MVKLKKLRCLSRNQVWLIAMISMLIDHCAITFTVKDSILYDILRWGFGRIAFPVFLILFIDGFMRTKHPWRHVLDLAIFAILAEPGYDRVSTDGLWFSWAKQNVMLTWLIIFGMMMVLHVIHEMYMHDTLDRMLWFFGSMMVIIVCAVVADLLRVDYEWCGPFVAGVGLLIYYCKPSLSLVGTVMSICLAIIYWRFGILLAIPVICCYDPDVICKKNVFLKYARYAFYPVHLTILGIIMDVIKTIPPA